MASDKPESVATQKSARLLDAGRLWRALGYSIKGFRQAYATESAFRQEAVAVVVLFPLSLWLPVSPIEHLALVASLVFVLVVELLNSAVEAAIDRISPDHHELSGRAKDFGSAAVLLSLLLAVATWITVLYPLLFGCGA
jgi:diacylglycerol kinase (ATP)